MEGQDNKKIDSGEGLSFQDIFSENFNTQIYEDIVEEEEAEFFTDDPPQEEVVETLDHSNEVVIPDNCKSESNLEEDELSEGEDEKLPEHLTPSFANAKLLNETYLLKLQDFLDNLMCALHANQSRQKELDEEIQNLSSHKSLMSKKEGPRKVILKPRSIAPFCAPYFKDTRMFTHPDNQDTTSRKALEELSVYTLQPPKWLRSDKIKLKNAILSDAVHKRVKDILDEEVDIKHRLQNSGAYTSSQRKCWEQRLDAISNKIKEVKDIPEEDLLSNPDEEFDWLKISAQTFKGAFNHKCIRGMWKNLLHPSINKSSWSKEEDDMLKELVSKYESKNWEAIAEELGGNRPAYLCFVRYQRKHKIQEIMNKKWTKEEDLRLRALVKQCRIFNYIPWIKVSYYMSNGRSKDMCYQRYVFSIRDEIKKGNFKMEEDFIVILGVHLFGTEWNKIARFLKNRTCTQVFSRYNISLSANLSRWTLKEDKRLLQAIKSKGTKNWIEISYELTSRTRYQCRKRFEVIFNAYRKDPKSFALEKSMKYSDDSCNLAKKRQDYLYQKLDELLENCLKADGLVLEENEPIPRDFLLRVMSILSDKLMLGTSNRIPTISLPRAKPRLAVLHPKERAIRNKYNDFFQRYCCTIQGGRERVRYKDHELDRFSLIATSFWKIFDCKDSLNLKDINSDKRSEKFCQLLGIIQNCPKELPKKENSSQEIRKPILKTYSRKKTNQNSNSGTSSKRKLEYCPPTANSCVAMKNTLSFLVDHYSQSRGPWKNESKKAFQKSQMEGIFAEKFAEMYWHLGLNKPDSETCSEADTLLMNRFKSIFFWPAVLSTIGVEKFEDASASQEDDITLLSTPSNSKRLKLK